MAIRKKSDIKLKGHESFHLREGWITKGIKAVKEDGGIFSNKEATDYLGVGTAMVKSIKYWLIALGLIKKNGNGFVLTEIGMSIYENDIYIEDRFTLWLLHYNLIKNEKFATAWNLFYNKFDVKEFTKEDLVHVLTEELIAAVGEENFSNKSLADDCTCIIKSYVLEITNETPEENFKCPFSELGLITRKRNRLGKEYFIRSKPNKNKMSKMALLYVMKDNSKDNESTIESLVEDENNIAKVFNIERNDINELLDYLEKENLIRVNRTAGLNTIYFEELDIIESYYNKRGR